MEIVSLLYIRNEGYKVKFPVFIEDISYNNAQRGIKYITYSVRFVHVSICLFMFVHARAL